MRTASLQATLRRHASEAPELRIVYARESTGKERWGVVLKHGRCIHLGSGPTLSAAWYAADSQPCDCEDS